jgi:predicted MFS family arabinose efflux permease
MRQANLIALYCGTQTLAQLGGFTFAALLPTFFVEWSLSHSEAGWLSGIFFGAYALSVPVLVTLTDRVEARKIYLFAVALTAASHLAMAVFADGFWIGVICRIAAGVGWAGTYMVGLRALTDAVDAGIQSRAVAANAASIGISGALSFLLAGILSEYWGWQGAFWLATLSSLAAFVMAWCVFVRGRQPPRGVGALFDFRPVLRNKNAMAYSLGYFAHTWEMFVLRSWAVTFLVFAVQEDGQPLEWFRPTVIAMLMELVGTATSVLGNEAALRLGRQRWILTVMCVSMVCALLIGFASGIGYWPAAIACLVYNAFIYADSASLTAGAAGSATPERKGATLAIHALLGYSGGFAGPLFMGVLLDGLGGESVVNWGISFGHVAVVMLTGPAALLLLRPYDLKGDARSARG